MCWTRQGRMLAGVGRCCCPCDCCIYSPGAPRGGFIACLFSEPGQTWLCPCTLCCQDSPFASLSNKGCVFVLVLGAGSGVGAAAGPSRARVDGEAESGQSLMRAKPAQPQPQGKSVRQLPAPALAPELPCPLSQPLGRAEGSSEVPVSCPADLATQKAVPKALTACTSVSTHEWCDGAPGACAAPRVWGTAGTWHHRET